MRAFLTFSRIPAAVAVVLLILGLIGSVSGLAGLLNLSVYAGAAVVARDIACFAIGVAALVAVGFLTVAISERREE